MREKQFEDFLHNEPTIRSEKAIASRMRKAHKIETILRKDLDDIVCTDDGTYQALLALQNFDDAHNNLQNTLRKYYKFANGKEFPRLSSYQKRIYP